MTKINRNYLYIGGGLLLLVLLYFAFVRETPITIETGNVDRGEILATVDAEGRTRYHDRFEVTAPVSGKMFRIELQEGDLVPRGYVITKIDPNPQRPIDPNQTPDSALAPYAFNVYSPVDGRITRIFEKSERILPAGTPLVEISKPSRLEIVADVLSTEATQVRSNMDVVVENWGGDEPLQARVRTVEPKAFTKVSALGVEEQRVNVISDFMNVPRNLGDNFRVDVRIVLWKGPDVVRVPASALFRNGEDWAAYVVRSGRAQLKTVKIGQRSVSHAEVLDGLAEGDSVILHPPNTVSNGTRVSSE